MKKLIYLLLMLSFSVQAQETPYFEYIWNEGNGTVEIPTADIKYFAQTAGRIEIDFTPGIIYTDNTSQRILDIPNHLSVWVYNDGVHGRWYNNANEGRVFRTRWGLPVAGVEIKIIITWDTDGYAVIVDDVLRIHDWQTQPTTIYPDPDAVNGVYGSTITGTSPVTGSFKIRAYDSTIAYDACSVDVVGTINEGVPLDNTGDWSQGIDPSCDSTTPPPEPEPPITTVPLTWNNAVDNTDGTLIPLTGPDSLVTTTMYWSICDPNDDVIITPGLEVTVSTTVPGQAESVDIDIGTPGRWCFKGIHTNQAGTTSEFSVVAIKEITGNTPLPPSDLVVDPNSLVAYSYSISDDKFLMIPVGNVLPGSPCDSSMSANGLYLVLREYVVWASSYQPPVVFAECY